MDAFLYSNVYLKLLSIPYLKRKVPLEIRHCVQAIADAKQIISTIPARIAYYCVGQTPELYGCILKFVKLYLVDNNKLCFNFTSAVCLAVAPE